MFATPCATSSMFERWRPPIMPSATTAESSDSTAREQRDGERRADERRRVRQRDMGQDRTREARPECRRSGCRSSRPAGERPKRLTVATISATNGPGTRRPTRGQRLMMARRQETDTDRPRIDAGEMTPVCPPLVDEVGRHGAHRQPEEILDLAREDDHGDAAGEADDDGIRDELDRRPEPRDAEDDEHGAGHQMSPSAVRRGRTAERCRRR